MMRVALVAVLMILPMTVQAQVLMPPSVAIAPARVPAASGNMPPDFYPHPKCEKPEKKTLVKPANDPDAMLAYNMKVRAFNQRAVAFNACIKLYVDNAQYDINAIQTIVHAADAEANQ
jgi:hypothetical protein